MVDRISIVIDLYIRIVNDLDQSERIIQMELLMIVFLKKKDLVIDLKGKIVQMYGVNLLQEDPKEHMMVYLETILQGQEIEYGQKDLVARKVIERVILQEEIEETKLQDLLGLTIENRQDQQSQDLRTEVAQDLLRSQVLLTIGVLLDHRTQDQVLLTIEVHQDHQVLVREDLILEDHHVVADKIG